jgi:hypothetical protein
MWIVMLLLIVPLEIFWLVQVIDCLRTQRDHRFRWIGTLLFLNLIGALYYWRLRPRNEMGRDDFDNALNTWMARMGFSWEKSRTLLGAMAEAGRRYFGLVVIVAILHAATGYIKLPDVLGWALIFLMIVLLIGLAISVTKVWWTRKDLITPFLADFIRQAKAGKKGNAPTFGTLENDPIATKSVPNLLLADFLFIMAPVFIFGGTLQAVANISKGNSVFGIIMLSAGCLTGLMFLFIAIQINSKVIFYHKPDYIFKLIRFYRFWKSVLFGVIMMLIIGFGTIFIVLAATGKSS